MIETANLFRCIDMIIETAKAALTEKYIKELCAVFAQKQGVILWRLREIHNLNS